jgi:hypothetical protein
MVPPVLKSMLDFGVVDAGVRGGPDPKTVDTKLFTFAIPN